MKLKSKILEDVLFLSIPIGLMLSIFGYEIHETSKKPDILLQNPLTIRDNSWNGQILVYDRPQDSWPNHLVDENMDWIPDYREWEDVERLYDYMRTIPTREDSLLLKSIEEKVKE